MALFTGWSVILSLFLSATRCTAQSLTTPTTAAASTSSNFIGYYISPDGQAETLLAGNAWTTSGTFAGDCNDESSTCSLATACQADTLYYNNDETLSCTGGLACVSFTIFQSSPNGSPSATNYGCRAAWSANTVYRELATATSTSTASPTTPSTVFTGTTPTSTIGTSTTASATPTSVSISGSSSSKAWIAGAVVGPIAALVVIALAFYFLRRHRRTMRAPESPPAPVSYQEMRYQDNHGYPKPGELDGTTTPSRQYVPVELDSGMHQSRSPAELS